ncbi:MAG: 6-pyruvoyl tetrahydropterin synthase family protein [Mariniblastus sp.]|nr:6-pyruvoyl tetrahydropterin synthase family protein [Mariniblastus sp.]
MPPQTFRVQLEKDNMVFSAAHFITFNGNVCESLHGHNYRVKCEVVGPLDENGYVVDFIALRDALAEIVNSLDHHVVLPTDHPTIKVIDDGKEVTATFESKRWVFPSEDCVLLPVTNTTAELMASYIAVELKSKTKAKFGNEISRLSVAVDENRGQWGVCELDWSQE